MGLADDHPAMKELANANEPPSWKPAEVPTFADGEGHIAPPVVFGRVHSRTGTPDDNNPPLSAFSPGMLTGPPFNPIVHLSAGTRNNLAVSRDGNAYSWGSGNQCEFGLGPVVEIQPEPVPSRVKSKALGGWRVEAGAGGQHCVLLAPKIHGR